MWAGSMTLEYVNYILWAPRINYKYLFIIHTFMLNLTFGWSCTPSIMHMI